MTSIGLELEAWFSGPDGSPLDARGVGLKLNGSSRVGTAKSDAGKGSLEVIGNHTCGIPDAVSRIRAVLNELVGLGRIHYCAHRPLSMGGRGEWVPDQRYEALIEGCKKESPDGWKGVLSMADWAAIHVNMSSRDLNIEDDTGVCAINIWNAIAPSVAAGVHRDVGYGRGHLGLWQRFADQRRFPEVGRWFRDFNALKAYFTSIPRLIAQDGSNRYNACPEENQVWRDLLDHGVTWWAARPKFNPISNEGYLEVRVLPSLAPENMEQYVGMVVSITERCVQYAGQHGNPACQESAQPLLKALSEEFPGYIHEDDVLAARWSELLAY